MSVRLALDSTAAAKLSRGADEAALSRQGKPALPRPNAPGFGIAWPGRSRPEIGRLWHAVLETRMDDEMGQRSKGECIIELIQQAKSREKLPGQQSRVALHRRKVVCRFEPVREGCNRLQAAFGTAGMEEGLEGLRKRPQGRVRSMSFDEALRLKRKHPG